MPADVPIPIREISISSPRLPGEIRGGKVFGSLRTGALQTRDLESSGGEISTTRGCNTTFPAPAALGNQIGYQGGPTASGATIQLLFWGSIWKNQATVPSPREVTQAVQKLMNSSYFLGLKEYEVDPGPLGRSLTIDSPEPPSNISGDDIQDVLWRLIGSEFPKPNETGGHNIYVFFLPPGAGLPEQFDGAHSSTSHFDPPFVHVAWYVWVAFAGGGVDAVISTLSHELVESYTNPEGNGWVNPNTDPAVSEIADICAQFSGTIDGLNVKAYFSKEKNACIIPGGRSVRDSLRGKGIDGTHGIKSKVPQGTGLRKFLSS